MSIEVVIAKPTKDCNADCSYCSAPPDHEGGWTLDQFKTIFDRVSPQLKEHALWIWHGGEPMLQGPEFYVKAKEYANKTMPSIRFSMQSNLLLYTTKKWKKVIEDVFDGSISTSFDPDEKFRTVKGSTEAYSKLFYKKIDNVIDDGFRPLVIGTYTSETKHFADAFYEKSKGRGDKSFSLRFNYRYPAGRASGDGVLISPNEYGEMLINLYNKWIKEVPNFIITPLDQMILSVTGESYRSCPWTNDCGGKYLGIEPNGDLYNCSEFADLGDTQYKFGNALNGLVAAKKENQHKLGFYEKNKDNETFGKQAMTSYPARLMARRRVDLPNSCKTCRHFKECGGGCMRDAELFENGLGGKFFYCESWMMVFDRIKESIVNNELDVVLEKLELDVDRVKSKVRENLTT